MSIDVVIKQKLFSRKPMPLEVILGDNLSFGNFVNDQLNIEELGDKEFVAYNPECIGRGFSVVWNPGEKKKVVLRLLHPSTPQELRDFYDAVERIVTYWGGKLEVDGNRISLSEFMSGFHGMVEFNEKLIKQFSQEILDGEHETLTFYSAMWPLVIGKDEAAMFVRDSAQYALWLHSKQTVDAYYATPEFYCDEKGIFARFTFMNGVPAAFPHKPTVPFGAMDPTTGRALECDRWQIWLGIDGEERPLGEIDYFQFLRLLPDSKKTRYDGARFLLPEMSEREIRELMDQALAGN